MGGEAKKQREDLVPTVTTADGMDTAAIQEQEKYYIASQWQLMWRKFIKHKLAIVGVIVLAVFYIGCIFCEFIAPYDILKRFPQHVTATPQRVRFLHVKGFSLRAPAVSWGVLLRQAQNMRTVAIFPWLLLPAVSVIVAVLAFNFLGDGLRDAADPYR